MATVQEGIVQRRAERIFADDRSRSLAHDIPTALGRGLGSVALLVVMASMWLCWMALWISLLRGWLLGDSLA